MGGGAGREGEEVRLCCLLCCAVLVLCCDLLLTATAAHIAISLWQYMIRH